MLEPNSVFRLSTVLGKGFVPLLIWSLHRAFEVKTFGESGKKIQACVDSRKLG